jgi:hypothetical protein
MHRHIFCGWLFYCRFVVVKARSATTLQLLLIRSHRQLIGYVV